MFRRDEPKSKGRYLTSALPRVHGPFAWTQLCLHHQFHGWKQYDLLASQRMLEHLEKWFACMDLNNPQTGGNGSRNNSTPIAKSSGSIMSSELTRDHDAFYM